jgi:hypothetical protein
MDNMQLLNDCVDLIIQKMPYQFEANQSYELRGWDLNIKPIAAKYPGNEEFFRVLTHTNLIFGNKEYAINKTTLGSFIAKPVLILAFNLSGFMQSAQTLNRDALLTMRRDDLPIKTFRAIVLHELRHMMQSTSYEKYYYGKGNDQAETSYKTSPIEIDAAWNHHLQDFDPKQFPTGNAYADAVMASFANYKTLSPEWQNHYRRKTIRYWMEATRQTQPDMLSLPTQQRLVVNRDQTKNWLVPALSQIGNSDYDLRQMAGYNPQSTRFLFPSNAIRSTAAMIGKDKQIQPESAPIAFFAASLVTPRNKAAEVHPVAQRRPEDHPRASHRQCRSFLRQWLGCRGDETTDHGGVWLKLTTFSS